MKLTLIGSCVDSIDYARPWLFLVPTFLSVIDSGCILCRLCRLWPTLFCPSVVYVDCDWHRSAHVPILSTVIDTDQILWSTLIVSCGHYVDQLWPTLFCSFLESVDCYRTCVEFVEYDSTVLVHVLILLNVIDPVRLMCHIVDCDWPKVSQVSTLLTVIDTGRLMCPFCRLWLTVIDSGAKFVDCDRPCRLWSCVDFINLDWLDSVDRKQNQSDKLKGWIRRLELTLIGSCVDSVDCA